MVYRIYVEKKKELAREAEALFSDIKSFLQIEGLRELRLINRYDVENIDRELFNYCIGTVFSEPQLDIVSKRLQNITGAVVFATEYLPGQFDQRADSAAQCIQIISQKERPSVRTARVYVLRGELSEKDIEAIKNYLINPVESREASLSEFETLASEYSVPESVETLDGFCGLSKDDLAVFINKYGLAMDIDDIVFCIKIATCLQ